MHAHQMPRTIRLLANWALGLEACRRRMRANQELYWCGLSHLVARSGPCDAGDPPDAAMQRCSVSDKENADRHDVEALADAAEEAFFARSIFPRFVVNVPRPDAIMNRGANEDGVDWQLADDGVLAVCGAVRPAKKR